jgi:cyclohexyl-isocyanide hydratase
MLFHMQTRCGMILYPGLTQLDLTGPYEVLCRVPGLKVILLAVDMKPVVTEHGMLLIPECTFDLAPHLDILFVPGGTSVNDLLTDDRYLGFIRSASLKATWVTSVCTGSLLLAAAGLLKGYRATTHWRSVGFLADFGAIPVADQRIVIDRNRITAAGVSAGIDFALLVAARLVGEQKAQEIQLGIEYDPQPPFNSGHPSSAPKPVRDAVEEKLQGAITRRKIAIQAALAKQAANP